MAPRPESDFAAVILVFETKIEPKSHQFEGVVFPVLHGLTFHIYSLKTESRTVFKRSLQKKLACLCDLHVPAWLHGVEGLSIFSQLVYTFENNDLVAKETRSKQV